MWKKFLCSSFVFLFFAASPAFASFSFKVDSIDPTNVTTKEQEIKVVISITDLPSESYFRVELQKNPGDNYIGYTKNDRDEWVSISSADCTNYFKISDTATTSATLYLKAGDDSDIASGDYSVKARRYTSSCATNTDSTDNKTVTFVLPTPMPTNTPVPSTPSPSNTPTPPPTSTPAPTTKPLPTLKPTIGPTIDMLAPTIGQQEFVNAQDNGQGSLLNLNDSPPPTSPTPSVLGAADSKPNPIIPILIIGVGAIGLVISLILLFFHSRKTAAESEIF